MMIQSEANRQAKIILIILTFDSTYLPSYAFP